MGSILTIATSKGDAGKTTLTAALAVWLARQKYSVAVLDADPNCGFSGWYAQAYEGDPWPSRPSHAASRWSITLRPRPIVTTSCC